MIIRDTREKKGWDFWGHTVLDQKLDCGDYTTSSLLGKFAIERKATTGELYINLATKTSKARFYRELDKLKKLNGAIILCEFPESYIFEFPHNSHIPRWRYPTKAEIASGLPKNKKIDAWSMLKINGRYLRSLIADVSSIIPVVFCLNKQEAEKYAIRVFEELENGRSS